MIHEEFMAFVSDDAAYAVMRQVAEKQGWPAATVQTGGAETALDLLQSVSPPKLLLVDLDGVMDAAGMASRLLALAGGRMRLLAIGTANDIVLYRSLIAAGVADYLPKPLQSDDVQQALARAVKGPDGAGSAAKSDAKVIVVMGTRGGVGASTIAVNLAWLYAHVYEQQTALLDLDLHYGTSALALDLEPGRGLREALENPSRLDSLLIASSMVNESERLNVMAAEEPLDEVIQPDPSALPVLLKEIRGNNQMVIVDLPRDQMQPHRRLFASADTVLLVTEQTLSGIRDTMRLKTSLKAMDCPARLLTIVSRVGKERPAQVEPGALERGLQGKPDCVVPEDAKSVAQAANQGKALGALAAQAPITKALRGLAELAAGISPVDPKKKGKAATPKPARKE